MKMGFPLGGACKYLKLVVPRYYKWDFDDSGVQI